MNAPIDRSKLGGLLRRCAWRSGCYEVPVARRWHPATGEGDKRNAGYKRACRHCLIGALPTEIAPLEDA